MACIIFQGGTDRPALFFWTEQIGVHSFSEAEQIGVHYFFRKTQLQTSLRAICTHLLPCFLCSIFWISQDLSYEIKTGLEGGRKSCGARFEVESPEKKSAPLSVPIEKRVHPYLFRFRKRVHPYLFRPKKECRPICSALKNDAGQPRPHLY